MLFRSLELGEKGSLDIRTISLTPMRDMIEIKGPIEELVKTGAALPVMSQDYVRAILTGEGEVYDAIGQLRQVYPNMMRIDFENNRSRQDIQSKTAASGDVARKSPMALFGEFYTNQNNTEMSSEEQKIMADIFELVGGRAK